MLIFNCMDCKWGNLNGKKCDCLITVRIKLTFLGIDNFVLLQRKLSVHTVYTEKLVIITTDRNLIVTR